MKNAARPALRILAKIYGFFATFPFRFSGNKIAKPKNVSHEDWVTYLSSKFNKKGLRVLEIGSRNVSKNEKLTNLRNHFLNADYVGFDFYDGENVDITGDAHQLSSYFSNKEKFDLVFSSAVFEHLHMPWVAATEIQKLVKLGGYVFIETHFSFSSHERPWNFFQFSDMGLRALFNNALGFDLIDSGMSNPMCGYFSHKADKYLKYRPLFELYCHSAILCKKSRDVKNFSWHDVSTDSVVDGTRYPMPENE